MVDGSHRHASTVVMRPVSDKAYVCPSKRAIRQHGIGHAQGVRPASERLIARWTGVWVHGNGLGSLLLRPERLHLTLRRVELTELTSHTARLLKNGGPRAGDSGKTSVGSPMRRR